MAKPKARPDEPPLHRAARLGDLQAVERLVCAGADPEERNEDSLTPLMFASSVPVAHALLAAGAQVDRTSEDGMDALSLALAAGNIEVAEALHEAGAPINLVNRFGLDRLGSAAFGRSPEAVEFLIAAGIRLAPTGDSGTTALHLVCWHGAASPSLNAATELIAQRLIESGVPPDARDCFGQTPMHVAVAGDGPSPSAVRALLNHGAKPDPIDHNGRTPLSLVGERHRCYRMLLEAGARSIAGLAPAMGSLKDGM